MNYKGKKDYKMMLKAKEQHQTLALDNDQNIVLAH